MSAQIMAAWGREVNMEELEEMERPSSTNTHKTVHHADVFDRFKEIIELRSFKIVNPTFLVSSEGDDIPNAKFMAGFEIQNISEEGGNDEFNESTDYVFQGAITNSHDKSLSIRCYFGTRVFVCSNGMWTADHTLSRKHTKNMWEEFSNKVWQLSGQLGKIHGDVTAGFEKLKEYDFTSQREVHDFIVQSCQRGVLPWQHAPKVLKHWNEPEHDEFRDRNGYCLFNAYTSHWRDTNQFILPSKTSRLKEFIDGFKNPQPLAINSLSTTDRYNEFASTPYNLGN